MANGQSRYRALIEKIFFDHYAEGATTLDFTRQEIKDAAAHLEIVLPDNLGDVIYSFRFRTELPETVVATQPEGMEWVIELAGRARYRFRLVKANRILPREDRPERFVRLAFRL
jgi:hypothetical protein